MTFRSNLYIKAEAYISLFTKAAKLRHLHVLGPGTRNLATALSPRDADAESPASRANPLPGLETLVLEKAEWEHPPDEGAAAGDAAPFSTQLVHALAARGSLSKLVIHRGMSLREEDVQMIQDSGSVLDVDWDGIVTMDTQ